MSFHAYPSRRPFTFILRAFEERVSKEESEWAPQDEVLFWAALSISILNEVLA